MADQPFVARERELAQLNDFLDRALGGQGQVVFVTGEAGTGKTALVHHFAQHALADHPDLVVAVGSSNAQTGVGDPYLPFREAIAMLTGEEATKQVQDIASENTDRLRTVFVRSVQVLVEVAPELIGVFVPGGKIAAQMGKALAEKAGWMDELEMLTQAEAAGTGAGAPFAEQSRIFEQYTRFIQRLSEEVPLVVFVDDLQWADTASIGLLFHLARNIESSRVLLLGAYRPADVGLGRGGGRHPLEGVVHELTRYLGDIEIDLNQIPERVSRKFLDALVDAEPNRLTYVFREQLYERTKGHALFTVELLGEMKARGALEQDDRGRWVECEELDWGALPAKVEGVIETRVGRLEEELREVLTVASVEGEEFTVQVLARVQEVAERELARQLGQELGRQHRLVHEQGMIRVAGRRLWRYAFRHVLFQRYLYEGLSELERGYLHEDVGKVLEELYGEETDGIAVQLARHFLEAGIDDKACEYLTRAGQQAIRVGAYREALGHLRRALDLLERLPETPETIQQELNVLIALGAAQIATEGQSSPEVKQTYDRALALCQRVGETPQLAQVLFGLSVFYFGQGQLRTTRELAERCLTIAQERGETTLLLEAHLMLGNSAFWLGDFAETLYHTEQIITLYDSGEQQAYSAQYAQNPRITCLTCATWATWLTGFPTRAAELSREALSLAEETGHPFNQAIAIETQAWLHQHRREFAATRVEAEKLTALTTAQGFPVYRALGTMLRGWALAHQGQPTAGLGQVRDGIVMWREMGFGLGTTFITVLLAEACLQAGLLDEGTSAVDEALASGLGADEKAYQAELYRLRGELLLARGEQAPGAQVRTEAATAFEGALDIARSQGAKMFELRATMSLCRLLHYQGDHAAAHTKLRAIYGGFTEGLETPDLQAAAALLDELASATGGAT